MRVRPSSKAPGALPFTGVLLGAQSLYSVLSFCFLPPHIHPIVRVPVSLVLLSCFSCPHKEDPGLLWGPSVFTNFLVGVRGSCLNGGCPEPAILGMPIPSTQLRSLKPEIKTTESLDPCGSALPDSETPLQHHGPLSASLPKTAHWLESSQISWQSAVIWQCSLVLVLLLGTHLPLSCGRNPSWGQACLNPSS